MPWRKTTACRFTKTRLAAIAITIAARGEATVFATGETTVIAAGKTTRSRRPAVVAGTALDALAVIETPAKSTTIATAEAATVGTARRTAELAIA